jgi:hypothetical protein
VAGSCRARLGEALWHGLCVMRIVSVHSFHTKSVHPSMPSINDGVRPAHRVPPSCPTQHTSASPPV